MPDHNLMDASELQALHEGIFGNVDAAEWAFAHQSTQPYSLGQESFAQAQSDSAAFLFHAADAVASQVADVEMQTERLSEATKKMGGVLDMVLALSGQINMLALNATIEAARPTDAAKCAADIASNIKNLANQVTAASQQISRDILGMQSVAVDVATTLTTLRHSVQPFDGSQMALAASEELPSAARSYEMRDSTIDEITKAIAKVFSELSPGSGSADALVH